MLHRLILTLCLTLLFAFTQIGVVTHEISHFNAPTQQGQQDQHTPSEQCAQCLAYAQSAAGILEQHTALANCAATFNYSPQPFSRPKLAFAGGYSARAPPALLS